MTALPGSKLEAPLEHIAAVDVSPPETHQIWHALRAGRTNLPGVITAGRSIHNCEWAVRDIHDPVKAIGINTAAERL